MWTNHKPQSRTNQVKGKKMKKFNLDNLEARLSNKIYTRNYTSIPNEKLGNEPNKLILKEVVSALGAVWDESDSYFTVRAKEGVLDKIYMPTVYSLGEGEGVTSYPVLRFSRKLMIPLSEIANLENVEMDFDGGKLAIFIPDKEGNEDNDILAFFRIFTKEIGDNTPTSTEMKQAFKKGKLQEYLGVVPQAKERKKLSTLEEGDTLTVHGYEPLETQYGKTFVINTDKGDFLSNTSCSKVLAASPKLSKEIPGQIEIISKSETRNGNLMVNCSFLIPEDAFDNSEELDLDF